MSSTAIGSGATNGAGIVWLITYVWIVPPRASDTGSSFGPPQLMHVGWIVGGVLIVPQSTHRPPRRPSISSAPRANSALSGGTPMGMVSPPGTSWPRARNSSAYDAGRPPSSLAAIAAAPGTTDSTATSTPEVRPPPVPTIATVPAVFIAESAPSSADAAPVSPTAVYTSADAAGAAPTFFAITAPRRP